jgi:hypothetical protein
MNLGEAYLTGTGKEYQNLFDSDWQRTYVHCTFKIDFPLPQATKCADYKKILYIQISQNRNKPGLCFPTVTGEECHPCQMAEVTRCKPT